MRQGRALLINALFIGYKKAKKKYPEIFDIVDKGMQEQFALENDEKINYIQ